MYNSPKRVFVVSLLLTSLLLSIFAGSAFAAGNHFQTVKPLATGNCTSSYFTVTLYKDFNQSGDSLCFQGPGIFNLTNYPGWNDQVSSWSSTGCTRTVGVIVFSVDINSGGLSQVLQYPGSGYSGNFTGTNGTIPNDSLSSINFVECQVIG
ncbi:hypothetical protein [Tengunoibacter tsumagoiensis]|nr:hypothetical protein [Tengunoibacter tsumagoiensis]